MLWSLAPTNVKYTGMCYNNDDQIWCLRTVPTGWSVLMGTFLKSKVFWGQTNSFMCYSLFCSQIIVHLILSDRFHLYQASQIRSKNSQYTVETESSWEAKVENRIELRSGSRELKVVKWESSAESGEVSDHLNKYNLPGAYRNFTGSSKRILVRLSSSWCCGQ